MKILILGLNFAPEPTGTGRCTADFALWLSERGHDVRVITATPHYPEWRIAGGYRAWMWCCEAFGAVHLLRCPLWVPAAATGFARILHLLSFAASSLLPSLWQAARFRPQLVWAVEPTACAAPVALLAARTNSGIAPIVAAGSAEDMNLRQLLARTAERRCAGGRHARFHVRHEQAGKG